MCLPSENTKGEENSSSFSHWKDSSSDLKAARKEIVREVSRAPMRRADNVITRLYDSVRLLKMHCMMIDAIRREYRKSLHSWGLLGAASALSTIGLSSFLINHGLWEAAVTSGALGTISTGLVGWKGSEALKRISDKYSSDETALDEKFRQVHHMSLAEGDDFVVSIWDLVKPQLQRSLNVLQFRQLPKLKSSELNDLDKILENDVPRLRRHSSRSASFNEAEAEEKAARIIESEN